MQHRHTKQPYTEPAIWSISVCIINYSDWTQTSRVILDEGPSFRLSLENGELKMPGIELAHQSGCPTLSCTPSASSFNKCVAAFSCLGNGAD